MVNEVAIVLLWGLVGPQLTIAYVVAGLVVAVFAGLLIGRLGLERYVEDYVWKIRAGSVVVDFKPTLEDRIRDAWRSTIDIVGRVWPYVIVGIGIGALIHGFVPTELVVQIGGPGNPLAVPALVALGVPLYSNAAGTIPIIEALLGKGLPVGSALAFMMAITALSLPGDGDPAQGHEAAPARDVRRASSPPGSSSSATCSTGSPPEPALHPRTREAHTVKVIEVLGPGCNNCQRLEANAREAVAQAGIEAEIRHVTDYAEIAQRGRHEHARARDRRQGRVGRQGRGARDDRRLAPRAIAHQRYQALAAVDFGMPAP